ncbi:MAG: T9SS type A sorting domain-containing protein [Dysgonamonadaceae bacterium]|jgi:hypothetical protein|nr:T9SS type A sorting domain-containing protein [Dysgonamonadaceae bacterium]
MKSKMLRAGFILLSFLFFAGNTTMKAENLYVYTTEGSREFPTANVQKLEFSETALVITLNEGDPVTVNYTELLYFSLKVPTFIGTLTPGATAIDVYLNSGSDLLTVSAEQGLTGLILYDLQGNELKKLAPAGALKIDVPLTSYPAGVYLLRVVDETGNVIVKKIIKN